MQPDPRTVAEAAGWSQSQARAVHRDRTGFRRELAQILVRGLPFPGYTRSWVAKQVGLAAVLALLLSVLLTNALALSGWQLPVVQLWPLLTGGLLVRWLLRGVAAPAPAEAAPALPDRGGGRTEATVEAGPRGQPFALADRWERRLSTTNHDPQWYARVVRDRLNRLAGERLRHRHGLGLTTDPDRARVVTGEELYEFLTEPVTRAPGPSELDPLVARMEEI